MSAYPGSVSQFKKDHFVKVGVTFNYFNNLNKWKGAQSARILPNSATYMQPFSMFCKEGQKLVDWMQKFVSPTLFSRVDNG